MFPAYAKADLDAGASMLTKRGRLEPRTFVRPNADSARVSLGPSNWYRPEFVLGGAIGAGPGQLIAQGELKPRELIGPSSGTLTISQVTAIVYRKALTLGGVVFESRAQPPRLGINAESRISQESAKL